MSAYRAVQGTREAICLSIQPGPRSRRRGGEAVPGRLPDELPRRTRFGGAGPSLRWSLVLALAICATGSAMASQGDLDPTFGTGGVARIPLGASVDSVGGLALQPDGKIVIATSAGSALAITRLNGLGA